MGRLSTTLEQVDQPPPVGWMGARDENVAAAATAPHEADLPTPMRAGL
jgi:hypothetical protein